MKKFTALLTALILMLTLAACSSTPGDSTTAAPANRLEKIKAAGKIIMATSPDFAPLEFIDVTKTGQDQYVGSDIELGRYIAEKLGVTLVIEAMDFAAVQAAVTTGAVDMAISGFAWKADRAESMELSAFFNNTDEEGGQTIIIPVAKADQLKTADDFAGLTLAAQNGSLQWELATNQLPDDVALEPIASLGDAVMMLLTGKIDGIVSDLETGEMLIQNSPELQISDFRFDYDSEGNVLGVPKGETELIDAINDIIKEVNEQKLYDKWSDEATELAKSLGISTDE